MSNTPSHTLSWKQIASFYRDGFVVCRNFFDIDELEHLLEYCLTRSGYDETYLRLTNEQGIPWRIQPWTNTGDSLLGVLPRLTRTVDTIETLLGEECYHWHSKLVVKSDNSPGEVPLHMGHTTWQPRGAWRPDIITCTAAITDCNADNGCFQVVRGSHFMGVIKSEHFGESSYADRTDVAEAVRHLEVIDCELKAGDAVFFHAQTLHGSRARVRGDGPRILLHSSYNAASNAQNVTDPTHRYIPLQKVPDSALRDRAYSSEDDGIIFTTFQNNKDIFEPKNLKAPEPQAT